MSDLLLAVVVIVVAVVGAEIVRLVCRRQLSAPAVVQQALSLTPDAGSAPLHVVATAAESEAA